MRTASPTHTAPSGFKKWAAAALLAGGLGVTGLALAGPASAQDNTSTTAKTEQTQPTQADAGTASNKVGDQADRPPKDGRGGPGLEAAAKAVGMSVDDLKSELNQDTSLADVAKAHDVEAKTVIDAMVTDAKTHIAEQVTAGDLTQAQADKRLANVTERITERVNTAGRPEGHGGPGGCDKDGAPPADGEAPAKGDEAPADAPAKSDDSLASTTADAPTTQGLGAIVG